MTSKDRFYLDEVSPSELPMGGEFPEWTGQDISQGSTPHQIFGYVFSPSASVLSLPLLRSLQLLSKGDHCAALARIPLPPKGKNPISFLRSAEESTEHEEALRRVLEEFTGVPPWNVDWEKVERGRTVWRKYAAEMGMGLLHFSLAGGFSSPPLVTILSDSSTNYLTSQKPRAVLHRLLETLQWVLDAMEFSLDPSKDGEAGGRAWEATIRVRFLHEGVRRSIGKRKEWKESEEVPINQLQMIATLGSFCVATIWSVERIGIRVSDEEKVAFLELWKVIGWYSGVDPMLLTTYFSDFKSASTFFLTASYHLFSPPSTSSTSTATTNTSPSSDSPDNPTLRILRAVSHQPPTYSSFFYHVQLSRLLLGNALADRLALPRVPIRARIQARLTFLTARLFVGFGQMWRKGWEEERREVTLKVLRVVVVNVFGAGRRSRFEKRERYEEKLGEGEGELEYDAGEGGKRALELVRRYRRLVAEMVTVFGVGGAGVAFLIFRLSRWLRVNRLM